VSERDALLAMYKVSVQNEIEEVKAVGEPIVVDLLPSDTDADVLLLLRWYAATQDSIMLYDGSEVYEKHVNDLILSDAEKKAVAFHELTAGACFRSEEQHKFAADVTADLEQLGGNNA
jgi:hypothetical protein